jgi:hypothetical protein
MSKFGLGMQKSSKRNSCNLPLKYLVEFIEKRTARMMGKK